MSSSYLIWFILIICVFLPMLNAKKDAVCLKIRKKRKKLTEEERIAMSEIIKGYIGKRCLVYSVGSNGAQIDGTINELSGNWIKLTHEDGSTEAISLDYIQRVREYPTNKKGKPKSIVLD